MEKEKKKGPETWPIFLGLGLMGLVNLVVHNTNAPSSSETLGTLFAILLAIWNVVAWIWGKIWPFLLAGFLMVGIQWIIKGAVRDGIRDAVDESREDIKEIIKESLKERE